MRLEAEVLFDRPLNGSGGRTRSVVDARHRRFVCGFRRLMKCVCAKRLVHDARKGLRPFPNQRDLRIQRVVEKLVDLAKEERAVHTVGKWWAVLSKELLN